MSLHKRKVELSFTEQIPRHWANGDAFVSHWLNAYTILIPDGEMFIIRACKRYTERLPEALISEVKALSYQEAQHSVQHKKAFDTLAQQGYRVKGFRRLSSVLFYKILEPVFPALTALSTASAIEHVNALIAEHFLSQEKFFDDSSKPMAQMFAWHFAEEIEHKSVVFDALLAINKSYLLRLFGLITTHFTFLSFLYIGAFVLAYQDRSLFTLDFWRGLYRFNFHDGFLLKLIRAYGLYLKRLFHPDEIGNTHLVDRGINIYQALKE